MIRPIRRSLPRFRAIGPQGPRQSAPANRKRWNLAAMFGICYGFRRGASSCDVLRSAPRHESCWSVRLDASPALLGTRGPDYRPGSVHVIMQQPRDRVLSLRTRASRMQSPTDPRDRPPPRAHGPASRVDDVRPTERPATGAKRAIVESRAKRHCLTLYSRHRYTKTAKHTMTPARSTGIRDGVSFPETEIEHRRGRWQRSDTVTGV